MIEQASLLGPGPKDDESAEAKIKTPIRAIRAKCLDCSGGSTKEVELCVLPGCPLYPYRLGKNPNRRGRTMTEEQRQNAINRLANARENKKSKQSIDE